MRIYLEFIEILSEGSMEEPDFIRVDVTDYSADDLNAMISYFRELAQYYSNCVIQKHYCYHEDDLPCSIDVLYQK
jgi:hypothetical protein